MTRSVRWGARIAAAHEAQLPILERAGGDGRDGSTGRVLHPSDAHWAGAQNRIRHARRIQWITNNTRLVYTALLLLLLLLGVFIIFYNFFSRHTQTQVDRRRAFFFSHFQKGFYFCFKSYFLFCINFNVQIPPSYNIYINVCFDTFTNIPNLLSRPINEWWNTKELNPSQMKVKL